MAAPAPHKRIKQKHTQGKKVNYIERDTPTSFRAAREQRKQSEALADAPKQNYHDEYGYYTPFAPVPEPQWGITDLVRATSQAVIRKVRSATLPQRPSPKSR